MLPRGTLGTTHASIGWMNTAPLPTALGPPRREKDKNVRHSQRISKGTDGTLHKSERICHDAGRDEITNRF